MPHQTSLVPPRIPPPGPHSVGLTPPPQTTTNSTHFLNWSTTLLCRLNSDEWSRRFACRDCGYIGSMRVCVRVQCTLYTVQLGYLYCTYAPFSSSSLFSMNHYLISLCENEKKRWDHFFVLSSQWCCYHGWFIVCLVKVYLSSNMFAYNTLF